jgi:D-3-phosphoglycerate dehydrogenase
VRVNSQPVEIVPEGVLVFFTNKDRPGIVGQLGTLLGRHQVNIANMSLSRDIAGGRALTVLSVDSEPPAAVIAELQKDPDISDVRIVKL